MNGYEELTGSELQPLSGRQGGIQIAVEGKDEKKADPTTIIRSEYGDSEVVIFGDSSLPTMVTYPDIGSNYDSCFKGFFQFCGENSAFKHFRLVHISPPGQHYGAAPLKTKLTMEKLGKHFEKVLGDLNIKSFHAFGCGAGSYVMLDYAAKNPYKILSMILVNPVADKSWVIDWFYEKCNIFANKYLNYDKWWKEQFLKRWFHRDTISSNKNLVELQEKLFFRTNQENIKNISHAFTHRTDITTTLKKIKARAIIICADGGLPEQEAVTVMGAMHHDTTWVKVRNSGVMLTQEKPYELLHPINLFYAGILGTDITKRMLERSLALMRRE
mmetsp:Transcript_5506/g.8148  ORF Transcript_5506/g.8148 Transcript_5506/m.8148 type:complete len:329 (+) Transcript_5506:129-1115(+)|eukprot:CAMPEP_0167760968 /NCGR_PEP_ID=MMETSP0110_2-20121227/11890_1 /TAXON_ID=629695 /ORGANISM="Gymnochlora sp., Strain CCMP2014" /LENGTH=328 /DNA_ID=CAMNT_0007647557 /DNA_START=85 /DNA_END=1071 /DNA_ORIENTATION=+